MEFYKNSQLIFYLVTNSLALFLSLRKEKKREIGDHIHLETETYEGCLGRMREMISKEREMRGDAKECFHSFISPEWIEESNNRSPFSFIGIKKRKKNCGREWVCVMLWTMWWHTVMHPRNILYSILCWIFIIYSVDALSPHM